MRMRYATSLLMLVLGASNAFAVTVSLNLGPARCGLNNGFINASVNGGLPPYTFNWSNGATTQTIQDLAPGDYTVTVTDGLSNTAQATGTIVAVLAMGSNGSAMQLQPDCQGMCTGIAIASMPYGGVQPYNYPPGVFDDGIGQVTIMGLCAPTFGTISITDANGCPGSIDINGAVMPVVPAMVTVQSTTPACEGQNNGNMTILMEGPAASSMEVTRIGGGYSQQHYPAWNVPYTITDLPAGDYTLLSFIPGGGGGMLCSAPYSGTIPEIAAPCGGVSGRVYHDADQDCSFSGFDLALPNKVLEIQPGPGYAISAADGSYSTGLLFGSYTIGQVLNNETQVCPGSNPQAFALSAGTPQTTVDFANVSDADHDLYVHIASTSARPGFPTQVWISVTNASPFPSGDVVLDLSFDPLLLSPQPANGQWNVGIIPPFGHETRTFNALVPADINLLGTLLNYSAVASNTNPEMNVANNAAVLDVTVTGSYDPNDKQGTTSSRLSDTQYFLAQDEWVDYTIRFQNTGTATAETVVVRDVLDDDLNITSLEILGSSHDFTPSFGEGRELVFTFNNIDLPDSTSDLTGSQGFISYRIKPNDDNIVGDELENTAGIYFDFNPPIITNTVTHVVELSTSMDSPSTSSGRHLSVVPNPVSDMLGIIGPMDPANTIFVVGTDGRVVLNERARSVLDVSHLAPGAYALRLVGTNGYMTSTVFIKQ